MLGSFGSVMFGSTEFLHKLPAGGLGAIALLGDTSSHGGTIITTNQDGSVLVESKVAAVQGAILACPIHGAVGINGNLSVNVFINGKTIVLNNSTADCGAVIVASSIKSFIGR